mgnify:CR=1 FL=1
MKDLIRHGDLLFVPVKKTQVSEVEGLREVSGKVIERGEVTGHAHRVTEGDVTIEEHVRKSWQSGDMLPTGIRYMTVHTPATVTHEEHKPVTLLPGLYEIMRAREFDYTAGLGRRVMD